MLLDPQVRLRLLQVLGNRIERLNDDNLVALCILMGYSFDQIQDYVREFS